MKTKKVGPLPVCDDLKVTIVNLLKRMSVGSRPILVVVCDHRFVGIKQASVRGIRVEFVAPEQIENLGSGDFILTYAYDDTVVDEDAGGGDGADFLKPFDDSEVVIRLRNLP